VNFYLLYGEDKSLIDKEINNIIEKLKVDTNNIIKYNLNTDTVLDVIKEASMNSLFANIKAIIIDITDSLTNKNILFKPIEEYIEHFNPNSYLIFVSYSKNIDTRKKIIKLIQSKGKVLELIKNQNYLQKYVLDYLNEDNYKMVDINYFLNKAGTNLDNISQELDKLKMYKFDDKTITKIDIDNMVNTNNEEEIFSLGNAVINNDKERALNLYYDFLNKGYEAVYIIVLLANQFRFLYQVKRLLIQNKSIDEIANILETNVYRVKYAISDCYLYHEDDLLKILEKLANLDKNIKLGNIDSDVALELFLVNKNL